jgi:hypothetical protein
MNRDALVETLKRIANGRLDGGRPLAAEDARQAAREALIAAGVSWRVPMTERMNPEESRHA